MTKPNGYSDEWDWGRFEIIDDGHYQGNMIFVLCNNQYQPFLDDYIFTEVSYGSCSSCDTFEHIQDLEWGKNEKNTEEQVKQYMTLALHMVQETKTFKQEKQ